MWTTIFYKDFFKNILLYMSSRLPKKSFSTYVCYTPDGLFWLNLYMNDVLSKICLLHMYVMDRMFYFEQYCKVKQMYFLLLQIQPKLTVRCISYAEHQRALQFRERTRALCQKKRTGFSLRLHVKKKNALLLRSLSKEWRSFERSSTFLILA